MERKPSTQLLKKNIPFVISGIAVAALIATSMSGLLLAAMISVAVIVVSLFLNNISAWCKSNISILTFIIAVYLLVIMGDSFYTSMIFSSKLQAISSYVGISIKVLVASCALLGMIIGSYFMSTVISAVFLNLNLDTQKKHDLERNFSQITAVSGKQLVMILVSATVAITICSKSSPIYPFNDWVDANCFLTVGKSMLHGLVPYRDLYEQKGPLLYMLHALAAMISDTTFIGVYFLEVIAASVFLFFCFKIMKLYQESVSIFLIPILAAVVYSARSFCHGDSAEELCLPMFSFAIYLVIKMIRYGRVPTRLEFVALGVTSAFVFWIKFSLLGFYLGCFCVIVWWLARHRDIRRMIHTIICIAVGFLIPTVFVLIYFGMNKAIVDMWTVYFYNNLFLYCTSSDDNFIISLILNLVEGRKTVIFASGISVIFIGIGLLALLKKSDKTEFFSYLIMVIFTFLLIYIGGRHRMYYSMIFNAFVPIGILAVYQTLDYYLFTRFKTANALSIFHRFKGGILCLLSLVYAFIQCDNTYLLNYDRSDLPQYEFAKIISKSENATLLNYGFLDGGFYTTTGIIPNCRFFCNLNIELDEIMQTQNRFVKEGKVEFVVTRDVELESDKYKCVAFSTFYLEGIDFKYFLYQREER